MKNCNLTAQDARLRGQDAVWALRSRPPVWRPSPFRTPRPVTERQPNTVRQSARRMTLIAGFRCTDGFVIAADTEMTHSSVSVQGHKLFAFDGNGYSIRIAWAGNEGLALDACQEIEGAIADVSSPNFGKIKRSIAATMERIYA